MATENVMLEFTEEAIREIARVAALANRTIENIGARRLHTCIERIIDEISFDACDYPPGDPTTLVASDVSKYPLDPLCNSVFTFFWSVVVSTTCAFVAADVPPPSTPCLMAGSEATTAPESQGPRRGGAGVYLVFASPTHPLSETSA